MAEEQKFSCPYCGTVIKTVWKEGKKPVCPNCSAQLDEIKKTNFPNYDAQMSGDGETEKAALIKENRNGLMGILIGIAACIIIGISCYQFLEKGNTSPTASPETAAPVQKSIYVEEIGRDCRWVPAAESYFDPDTDCHFWYNDEIDYPTWQYFYGSISTDFGDYGWMEYREDKDAWYIEADEGKWIRLPEKYDIRKLWHIQE